MNSLYFVANNRDKDCGQNYKNADLEHNVRTVDTLLDMYEEFPRKSKTLLALASVGVEYTCVSLYHECCKQKPWPEFTGESAIVVRKIPKKIYVKDIYKDLITVSRNLKKDVEKLSLEFPNLDKEILYYDATVRFINYCGAAYGLYTLLGSLKDGNSMATLIVAKEMDNYKEIPNARIKKDIGNCISISLLSAIAGEVMDKLDVPITSECKSSKGALSKQYLNLDKYFHTMALSVENAKKIDQKMGKASPERVSGSQYDVYNYILNPLEARLYDSQREYKIKNSSGRLVPAEDAYVEPECMEYYQRNLRILHDRLKSLMNRRGYKIARSAIPWHHNARRSESGKTLQEERLEELEDNMSKLKLEYDNASNATQKQHIASQIGNVAGRLRDIKGPSANSNS